LLAASWLLEQGAALDTMRRFLSPPLNDEQQALMDQLVTHAESRTIEGYTVIVSATHSDHYVTEISSVAHRLRDLLEPAALFILVEMGDSIQLVARAGVDAIDVGAAARTLGGGGHGRAAAGIIRGQSLAETAAAVWKTVGQIVQPIVQVAAIMSRSAQTVDAAQKVGAMAQRLRRTGHEGYPVLENSHIVGLLTRRDVDRALEHGLYDLTARDLMNAGVITVRPEDSINTLAQRMVGSGWGQIPVVDGSNQIIGIVTRTDLIKHWTESSPSVPSITNIAAERIEDILGRGAARLIETVANHAQAKNMPLYLVGGVVRDLLLSRPNLDIDFVTETNAIELAENLRVQFGGKISSFQPFGTAKWQLDQKAAADLAVDFNMLPDHVDFATARNEFYEYPTALPTVYSSSIKPDLHRRDFTINTLALQLSPDYGHVLDFYGGLRDLEAGVIRVLHSLSFVDDPTRIVRAVRFEQRLNFTIESRTAELIQTALPMLGRITGERLRNELTLVLGEAEPERILLSLQKRGVLEAIHPAFSVRAKTVQALQTARSTELPWVVTDIIDLYWHILAASIAPDRIGEWCERLLLSGKASESLLQAAQLTQSNAKATTAAFRPSQIVRALEGKSELALLTAWVMAEATTTRDSIQRYWLEWRTIRPIADGHTLRETGLQPGPCYRIILDRLRSAWLDGEIQSEAEEKRLIEKWVHEEGVCDDHS
jgi:tRNA nucleotidyltransferase (CCA-adding enzyme)